MPGPRPRQQVLPGWLQGISTSAGNAWRENVPLNARLYLEAMAGKTAPVTERDLTPNQRASLGEMIVRHQAGRLRELQSDARGTLYQNPQREVEARRNLRTANTGSGYADYRSYANEGMERPYNVAGESDKVFNREAADVEQLRSSLGRFRYQMLPGGISVTDSYDFNNPDRQARIEELNRMNPVQRAFSTAAATAKAAVTGANAEVSHNGTLSGILPAIAGQLAMGVIGDRSRPVNITLPMPQLSRGTNPY